MGKWQVKTGTGGNSPAIPTIPGNTNALLTRSGDGWVKSSSQVTLMEDEKTPPYLLSSSGFVILAPSGHVGIAGSDGFSVSMLKTPDSSPFKASLTASSMLNELRLGCTYGEREMMTKRMGIDFILDNNLMELGSSGDMDLNALKKMRLGYFKEGGEFADASRVHTAISISPNESAGLLNGSGIEIMDFLQSKHAQPNDVQPEAAAFVRLERQKGAVMEAGWQVEDSIFYHGVVNIENGEGIRIQTNAFEKDNESGNFAAQVNLSQQAGAVIISAGRDEGAFANDISGEGSSINIGIETITFSSSDAENGKGFINMPTRIYDQEEEPELPDDGFAFWVNKNGEFYLIVSRNSVQKKVLLQ